jgi:hypothetical protein
MFTTLSEYELLGEDFGIFVIAEIMRNSSLSINIKSNSYGELISIVV